jgi:hypothetical protein
MDCPGLSVTGRFPPETENPDPVVESELMVTAAVPPTVRVTDFETDVPTATLPKTREVVLRLNVAPAAFRFSATLFEELPVLAVRVAV